MPRIEVKEDKFFWTKHSKKKMDYYRLSGSRVLRIFRNPERVEEGIAPGTIASMQVAGTKKNPTEIWLMYQVLKRPKGIKVISTWRYPGRTPKGVRPDIPKDVLEELEGLISK